MFQFKQFSIQQNQSAMKVGTDGVLLGAWVPVNKEISILDIGTGTGLIAIMLAQRNLFANIDAVEIDKAASIEASMNFKNSPWKERLHVDHTSLEYFVTNKKYDLIISNPPYFTDTYLSEKKQKNLARHVGDLSFKMLLKQTVNLLASRGSCAFIIPYKEEEEFIKLALDFKLFIVKITRVKGKVNLPYKRSLLYFKQKKIVCKEDELVLEIERHVYTKDYIKLTKSFYLKM